jgi:hypothetical protein
MAFQMNYSCKWKQSPIQSPRDIYGMRAHLPIILMLFNYIQCLFKPNKKMKLYALTSTRIMNEILSLDMEGY